MVRPAAQSTRERKLHAFCGPFPARGGSEHALDGSRFSRAMLVPLALPENSCREVVDRSGIPTLFLEQTGSYIYSDADTDSLHVLVINQNAKNIVSSTLLSRYSYSLILKSIS